MHEDDDIVYYRRRAQQELRTAQALSDPLAARLHWEMAQQYANRALLLEEALLDRAGEAMIPAAGRAARGPQSSSASYRKSLNAASPGPAA